MEERPLSKIIYLFIFLSDVTQWPRSLWKCYFNLAAAEVGDLHHSFIIKWDRAAAAFSSSFVAADKEQRYT